MATPTQPTVANLVAEAFAKVGIASPTTAQTARVTAYHLEELKNDIWTRAGIMGNQRLKSLQDEHVQMTVANKTQYSFPTDFDEEIQLIYLDGTHTDTYQTGTTLTCVLASDEDATSDGSAGKWILVNGSTSGTQLGQIVDYSSTAVTVTVADAWTSLSSGGTYRIVDDVTILEEENELESSIFGDDVVPATGDPDEYTKYHKDGTVYFALNKAPTVATKGILTRYYKNLMLVSTTSAEYNKILYDWRAPITVGLAARIAEDNDDTKSQIFRAEYERLVKQLLDREIPYGGEFEGFEL